MPKPNSSPPGKMPSQQPALLPVDAAAEVDQAGRVQRLAAEQRHRNRQRPHAQPAQAAEQDRVADAAHGAEMAALEDGAGGNAEQQVAADQDERRGTVASPSLRPREAQPSSSPRYGDGAAAVNPASA